MFRGLAGMAGVNSGWGWFSWRFCSLQRRFRHIDPVGSSGAASHARQQSAPAQDEGLGLAMFRADGFVSLDAGLREGIIDTKPFFARGAKLIINARCGKKGYVDVEIADEV